MSADITSPIQSEPQRPKLIPKIFQCLLFSGMTGGCLGALAFATALPYAAGRTITASLILSFCIGAIIGLICTPAAALLWTTKRDLTVARPLVLWTSALAVVLLSAFAPVNALGLIIVGSVSVYLIICILAWALLPRVWDVPGLCRKCGYDLRGSMQFGRCPECGAATDAGDALDRLRRHGTKGPLQRVAAHSALVSLRQPWLPVLLLIAAIASGELRADWQRSRREHQFRAAIANAITERTALDLAEVFPFSWERVCIFGPYSTRQSVETALGFRWPEFENRIYQMSETSFIAFVVESNVVEWLEPRFGIDISPPSDRAYVSFEKSVHGRPILRSEAVFRAEQQDPITWKLVQTTSPNP